MRPYLLGLGLLLGVASANAQQSPEPLTLKVSVEEAMLIVQMLGQIGCQNVQQLIVCQQAAALLGAIRDQVKAQQGGPAVGSGLIPYRGQLN